MAESLSFDRVATQYDATRGYPAGVARTIADGLIRLGAIPAGGAALEIGIGTGRIALPLLARGVNVTGVDIAPRMLERLQSNYETARSAAPEVDWGALSTQVTDMTALPFADATFDATIAVHVLHLVPGWQRALDEALRVIQPGGSFLLGQDVSASDTANHQIQDQWLRTVRELGGNPDRPGAKGYGEMLAALRACELAPEEAVLASWTVMHTPRGTLQYVADRIWSQTWGIPDDIFAASILRLEAWVKQRYGAALDTPLPATLSFKAARARV
jgi:ubiquinone/menaquinone biosynthesis C-methylase UbiE